MVWNQGLHTNTPKIFQNLLLLFVEVKQSESQKVPLPTRYTLESQGGYPQTRMSVKNGGISQVDLDARKHLL